MLGNLSIQLYYLYTTNTLNVDSWGNVETAYLVPTKDSDNKLQNLTWFFSFNRKISKLILVAMLVKLKDFFVHFVMQDVEGLKCQKTNLEVANKLVQDVVG